MNPQKILKWYDKNARQLPWRISPADRKSGIDPDPYRVWLSEIMLQQTTIATVTDYFIRFLEKWPTIDALASAPLDDVLKMWAGLGYYARARNLHACAGKISMELCGIFPQKACALLQLPGIGPYTSAAIAAICFDQKVAVVDGNVERVMVRYLALNIPIRQTKSLITQAVQAAVPNRAGDFAQGLMDLGSTICTPKNPDCNNCPLKSDCAGFASKNPEKFPLKEQKKLRPVRYGHAFIIQHLDGAIFMQKRPEKGLLAQMTQVPTSNWNGEKCSADFPIQGDWNSVGEVVHIFTHFRLELQVWRLMKPLKTAQIEGWFVPRSEINEQALPSVFRKVLAKAGLK